MSVLDDMFNRMSDSLDLFTKQRKLIESGEYVFEVVESKFYAGISGGNIEVVREATPDFVVAATTASRIYQQLNGTLTACPRPPQEEGHGVRMRAVDAEGNHRVIYDFMWRNI